MNSFIFDHVRVLPHEQIGLNAHSTWEISYIIKGNGWRTLGGKREKFEPNEIILVPPDIPHEWTFNPASGAIENITIVFSDAFLTNTANAFPEYEPIIQSFSSISMPLKFTHSTLKSLSAIMKDMCDMNDADRLLALLKILSVISKSEDCNAMNCEITPHRALNWLREIETYVRCNYQQAIKIDDIAHHMGMSRSTFCTTFKNRTGKTFITYVNDFRMNIAKGLLSQGQLSVSQVCYKSGFNDIPYFNRLFKKLNGMTPLAYKKASFADKQPFITTSEAMNDKDRHI